MTMLIKNYENSNSETNNRYLIIVKWHNMIYEINFIKENVSFFCFVNNNLVYTNFSSEMHCSAGSGQTNNLWRHIFPLIKGRRLMWNKL